MCLCNRVSFVCGLCCFCVPSTTKTNSQNARHTQLRTHKHTYTHTNNTNKNTAIDTVDTPIRSTQHTQPLPPHTHPLTHTHSHTPTHTRTLAHTLTHSHTHPLTHSHNRTQTQTIKCLKPSAITFQKAPRRAIVSIPHHSLCVVGVVVCWFGFTFSLCVVVLLFTFLIRTHTHTRTRNH